MNIFIDDCINIKCDKCGLVFCNCYTQQDKLIKIKFEGEAIKEFEQKEKPI